MQSNSDLIADRIAKYAALVGWTVDSIGRSNVSGSAYVTVSRDMKEDDDDPEWETLKIRVSDHVLPPSYHILNGSPDYEASTSRWSHDDTCGDWVDCIVWLAKKSGAALPAQAKRIITQRANLERHRQRQEREREERQRNMAVAHVRRAHMALITGTATFAGGRKGKPFRVLDAQGPTELVRVSKEFTTALLYGPLSPHRLVRYECAATSKEDRARAAVHALAREYGISLSEEPKDADADAESDDANNDDVGREVSGAELAALRHVVGEHVVQDLASAAARRAKTRLLRSQGLSWRESRHLAADAKPTPDMLRVVRAQLERGASPEAARHAAMRFYYQMQEAPNQAYPRATTARSRLR